MESPSQIFPQVKGDAKTISITGYDCLAQAKTKKEGVGKCKAVEVIVISTRR